MLLDYPCGNCGLQSRCQYGSNLKWYMHENTASDFGIWGPRNLFHDFGFPMTVLAWLCQYGSNVWRKHQQSIWPDCSSWFGSHDDRSLISPFPDVFLSNSKYIVSNLKCIWQSIWPDCGSGWFGRHDNGSLIGAGSYLDPTRHPLLQLQGPATPNNNNSGQNID